ncbi:MAG: hypothetical protein OXD36_02285 [Rhodobacter sp.]|nr:hypothetical protein [Rhodobacter sp.]
MTELRFNSLDEAIKELDSAKEKINQIHLAKLKDRSSGSKLKDVLEGNEICVWIKGVRVCFPL